MAIRKSRARTDKDDVTKIVYAPIENQIITDTIEKNYMPYVMSVIISRAIPEIDGLKPSHRKLLYTMYKMGLLTGGRTKSANVVGQTMKLNPHGDMAIYETLVRLTRGNEALLHPLIDSKGSFGKQYSANMRFAASRYTECKLDPFCAELFRGIDKNAVDMVPNYDNTMEEPVLLPTTFPNVLVTPNTGIAVGMASNICPFNLAEICDGTIALLKNPKASTDRILDIVKAPDFPGGGSILYDRDEMRNIYETGSGSVRIRARYTYDKDANCIDILQIPYSTNIEAILDKLTELVKNGQLREVNDFRDEIDLNGFKLTVDLRRGVDPDKLMLKLFKLTPLEDAFKCNFNVLIHSAPRQLGVVEILREWIAFRLECVRRELNFDLGKKQEKLHLLLGLGKILLDIDKAITIIRRTEKEEDVIPNLMTGFEIDKVQAEYIAEIKLRNLNKEYILRRIQEIEGLQKEIASIEEILADELKQKAYIASQLTEIKKKYGQPRRSQLVYPEDVEHYVPEEEPNDFDVHLLLTREGYFKKITPQSLKGNDKQLLKDDDEILLELDGKNNDEWIVLTNQQQFWRVKVADFSQCKASVLGDYLPARLGMSTGEKPVFAMPSRELKDDEYFVFLFENGKGVRVPLSSYAISGTRKKLTGAYSAASPLSGVFFCTEKSPVEFMLVSDADRAIVLKSDVVPVKSTRSAGGVTLMTMKKNNKIVSVLTDFEEKYDLSGGGFRKRTIPAGGSVLVPKGEEKAQLTLDI